MKQRVIQAWLPKAIVSLCSAVALLASTAFAETITPTTVAFPTPGMWLYAADHTSGELHPGDSFTIFDFGGYVGGSVFAPALWTAAAVLVGSTPVGAPLSLDNPAEWNLLFTYTGPIIQTATGLTPLGFFGATTTSGAVATDDWISRDHLLGTLAVGDGGVGEIHRDQILVPAPAAVPDGGLTLSLLGFALVGLAGLRRKLGTSK